MESTRMKKKKAVTAAKRVRNQQKTKIYRHTRDVDRFNQFQIPEFEVKTGKGKAKKLSVPIAMNAKALVPATGIYSPEWTKNIAPNTGLLYNALSLDLRLKVFEYAMDNIARGSVWNYETLTYTKGGVVAIEPTKHLDKFRDKKGYVLCIEGSGGSKEANSCASLGKQLNDIYLICKQAYVEVHGTGLFYRNKAFSFSSARMLMDYLSVINPISRNAITELQLCFPVPSHLTFATTLTFPMLNSMESLQSLSLDLYASSASGNNKLIKHLKSHKGLKGLKGIKKFTFDCRLCPTSTQDQRAQITDILTEYKANNARKYAET